jgi:hypothetical protein
MSAYLNVLKKQLDDLNFEDTTVYSASQNTSGCDQVSFQVHATEEQAVGACYVYVQRSLDDTNWETDGDAQYISDDQTIFLSGTQPLSGNFYRTANTITGGGEMTLDTHVLGKGFV